MRADRPGATFEMSWTEAAEGGRLGHDVFDPHGIAARALPDGAFELLVVDHGGGEAVGRLRVEVRDDRPVITTGERVVQPPGTSGNAVSHMPDGGFVLTSMFDPGDPHIIARFARAEVTGGVWRWVPSFGWSRFGAFDFSGANAIASSAHGTTVIVSEWAARRIWRLGPDGAPEAQADTRFLPDNLRWCADGRLLVAGQAAAPQAVFGCQARGGPCPLAKRAEFGHVKRRDRPARLPEARRHAERPGTGEPAPQHVAAGLPGPCSRAMAGRPCRPSPRPRGQGGDGFRRCDHREQRPVRPRAVTFRAF